MSSFTKKISTASSLVAGASALTGFGRRKSITPTAPRAGLDSSKEARESHLKASFNQGPEAQGRNPQGPVEVVAEEARLKKACQDGELATVEKILNQNPRVVSHREMEKAFIRAFGPNEAARDNRVKIIQAFLDRERVTERFSVGTLIKGLKKVPAQNRHSNFFKPVLEYVAKVDSTESTKKVVDVIMDWVKTASVTTYKNWDAKPKVDEWRKEVQKVAFLVDEDLQRLQEFPRGTRRSVEDVTKHLNKETSEATSSDDGTL